MSSRWEAERPMLVLLDDPRIRDIVIRIVDVLVQERRGVVDCPAPVIAART